MDREVQIRHIEEFLDKVMVQELGKLQSINLTYMQFVLMGQAIEVLGSFYIIKRKIRLTSDC